MIFVLAGDYRQFQGFLQEFHLREHFGDDNQRRGQVAYLGSVDRLRGCRDALVLCWGTYYERHDEPEIRDTCAYFDIPMIEVPDLKRARARRERPELFAPVNFRPRQKPSVKW